SDGTAWMAMYCLNLLNLSLELAFHNPVYEDIATKFFEHFALIATAINDRQLWNEADGFYYDQLRCSDGRVIPLAAPAVVGLLPPAAVAVVPADTLERLDDFAVRVRWFVANRPEAQGTVEPLGPDGPEQSRLLAIVAPDRLRRLLARALDPDQFLSDHGLR